MYMETDITHGTPSEFLRTSVHVMKRKYDIISPHVIYIHSKLKYISPIVAKMFISY
jgi:hypothetical protein